MDSETRLDIDDTYVDIILDDLDLDDDREYYAAFELVYASTDDLATTEFVREVEDTVKTPQVDPHVIGDRDHRYDHIITVKVPLQPAPPPTTPRAARGTPSAPSPRIASATLPRVPSAIPTPSRRIARGTSAPSTSTPPVAPVSAPSPASTPYERIDIAIDRTPTPMPLPMYSVPYERVDLAAVPIAIPAERTEIVAPPTSMATRVIAMTIVLIGALLLGIALVLLLM